MSTRSGLMCLITTAFLHASIQKSRIRISRNAVEDMTCILRVGMTIMSLQTWHATSRQVWRHKNHAHAHAFGIEAINM